MAGAPVAGRLPAPEAGETSYNINLNSYFEAESLEFLIVLIDFTLFKSFILKPNIPLCWC